MRWLKVCAFFGLYLGLAALTLFGFVPFIEGFAAHWHPDLLWCIGMAGLFLLLLTIIALVHGGLSFGWRFVGLGFTANVLMLFAAFGGGDYAPGVSP